MKDIANTVLEPIKQRLKSPIIGSIALSWILVNWKGILVLIFSSKAIEDRLFYISTKYYNSTWNLQYHLLFPVILAGIYLFLHPRIENLIDDINKPAKDKKMEFTFNVDEQTLINRRSLVTIEKEIEDIKSGFREVQTLNQKVDLLNSQLEEKNTIITEYDNQINSLKSDYGHMQGLYREGGEIIVEKQKEIDLLKNLSEKK